MHEIFGDNLAIVPYVMPGLLAKLATEIAEQSPEAEGLLLLQHGHFTWGDNAKQSYERVINHTNKVENWFANRRNATQYHVTGISQAKAQNFIHDFKKALIAVSANASQSFVLDWIDDPVITSQIDQHISNGVLGAVLPPLIMYPHQNKALVLTHNIRAGGWKHHTSNKRLCM